MSGNWYEFLEAEKEQGLVRFDENRKFITYVSQNRKRNDNNPEEKVLADTFLTLVLIYGSPAERIKQFVSVQMGSDTKVAGAKANRNEITKMVQPNKSLVQTASTDEVNLLKKEPTENYIAAKQTAMDDYPIFMTIAEDIGYDAIGRSTASYSILLSVLNWKEFINADEIAKGLSPFQPETAGFEAGRIMLHHMEELLNKNVDFAFETTLATKSFAQTARIAQKKRYTVTLLFFWLNSVELAQQRVALRVAEGGHNIPSDITERRYYRGIKNLFKVYLNICDNVMVFDNSERFPTLIFQKTKNTFIEIANHSLYKLVQNRI